MRKCSGYHPVSKSQFHQKVDIEPLCCQPLIHSHIFLIHSTFYKRLCIRIGHYGAIQMLYYYYYYLAFPNVTDQKYQFHYHSPEETTTTNCMSYMINYSPLPQTSVLKCS